MQGDQYWTVQNKHRKKKKKTPKNNIHFKSTTKNPFMHNIIHLYYMRFVQHHTKKKNKQLTPCAWWRCWPWYAHEAGEGQNPTATPLPALPALPVQSEDSTPAVSCSARLSHAQHRSSCKMKYGDGWTSTTRIRQQATVSVYMETVQITTHLDSTIFKQGIVKVLWLLGGGGGGGGYAKSEWDHQ